MSARMLVTIGVGAVAAGVVSLNVFAHELNTLFLQYPGIDKVLHVIGYSAVYVFMRRALFHVGAANGTRWAWTLTLLLAMMDETIQAFVPGRSFEALDIVANVVGTTLGWTLTRRRADRLGLAAAVVAACSGVFVVWQTHSQLANYSLALRYERQHDFVRAREHYQRALATGMKSAGLYNELGWVEIESGVGDPEKAVIYARTALELEPGDADILDTYGWALHHAGRSAEALGPLLEAFSKDPQMYCIHYHLGAVYRSLGRRDEAERHFRRQVELSGTREAELARTALERMTASQ